MGNMESTGEAADWERSLRGDGEAFGLVFDRHNARVFRHAYGFLHNRHDAEDATAAAFLELWRRRSIVRLVNGSVLPWLLVTTTNLVRNHQRAARRYRAFLAALSREAESPDAADEALDLNPLDAMEPELAAAVLGLKPADRQLVALIVVAGYSIGDAAALLDITPSAAKTRLHRARLKLREAMAPEPPDHALPGPRELEGELP
ncbi:RNA polymerase sigma-70 factor (ECF subfamily) [Arthrobacter silviterrae]|uniref:RNA polymerase sigma factor n=1 Tax=Arthrobacter silviterrae TaxID=2026658 RepID=A0ABX0DAX2_9MICC|nr:MULTISPECIES: RNA polymerase sigma factor [Arthrobacter]MCU6478873.1 RNA polymerase sigma factor [Arthrobacter sp. A2-55]MDQ0277843.1 RNA polymerase sigma-70 factor (ECF subfamily) [Arthrobacter silviterrae]NGN83791.1 RNA polymerase sigma factor [Arthrobacter silviterrae]